LLDSILILVTNASTRNICDYPLLSYIQLFMHIDNSSYRVKNTVRLLIKGSHRLSVADLGGVRGVQMHGHFCVHNCTSRQMIIQQWHTATTTRYSYTLTYQFLTDLQTFD